MAIFGRLLIFGGLLTFGGGLNCVRFRSYIHSIVFSSDFDLFQTQRQSLETNIGGRPVPDGRTHRPGALAGHGNDVGAFNEPVTTTRPTASGVLSVD